MGAVFRSGARPALATKLTAAAMLVGLADLLVFQGEGIGWTLGGFALAFALAWAAVQPAATHDRRALAFLGLALLMGALLAARPTFAGWFLFGCFLGMASLSPRAGPADDAWRWFQRLAWQPICGSLGPLIDLGKLARPKLKAQRRPPLLKVLPVLALPVVGGLLFLGLFSAANPIIAEALSGIETGTLDLGRIVFWGFVFVVVWAVLRPRFLRRPAPTPGARGDASLPGVTAISVILSLVVFNALFAVQNGLDIAFLWSGQRLPEQFTLAEYVHAGVYPLMASALLTGLFVLIALRPGSQIAADRTIRALVVLWVAQNLFVVASSACRMVLYVESYSLTRLRILVLLWMALVAIGLASILWRLLKDRSTGWLLNINAGAALAAVFGIAVIDIGAVAAQWNVRNAKEAGGTGVELDVCYLRDLGDAAILPLAELAARDDLPRSVRARAEWQRRRLQEDLENRLGDWRRWTGIGAWRLAQVDHLPTELSDQALDSDCRSEAKRALDAQRGGYDIDPPPATAPPAATPPSPQGEPPAVRPDGPPDADPPSQPSLTTEPQSR